MPGQAAGLLCKGRCSACLQVRWTSSILPPPIDFCLLPYAGEGVACVCLEVWSIQIQSQQVTHPAANQHVDSILSLHGCKLMGQPGWASLASSPGMEFDSPMALFFWKVLLVRVDLSWAPNLSFLARLISSWALPSQPLLRAESELGPECNMAVHAEIW